MTHQDSRQGKPVRAAGRGRWARVLALGLLAASLAGCASGPVQREPHDPLEAYNREMHAFNTDFDRKVLKPVAQGYRKFVPAPVDRGVSNFFSNLDDVIVVVNDIGQLKIEQAASDLARFTLNSTVGIVGLFDVASTVGLRKHNEDFGQTLGRWGMGPGPYLVLPFLGPSSLRDGVGLAVDSSYLDPVNVAVEDDEARWALRVVEVVDTRAGLLRGSRVLDTAALDPYLFTREAYLQRRRYLVFDGAPPLETDFPGDDAP